MHLCDIFPFNSLNDSDLQKLLWVDNVSDGILPIDVLNSMNIESFISHDSHTLDNDPDTFLQSSLHLNNPCSTYLSLCPPVNPRNNDKVFNVISFNICSVPQHFDEFITACIPIDSPPSAICLSQTKLTNDIDNLYQLEGYNKFTLNNTRDSGGLAIFVKNHHKALIGSGLIT